ncbi:MAG: efflux RND transporter periplasmic adaptor subunit [Planctomycetota bacterium]|jgi:HlyD family secretion protein
MKKLLLYFLLPAGALFLAYKVLGPSGGETEAQATATVQRGSIHVNAVAVGKVEARFEVPVTATSGGVVTQKFVKLGQLVRKGDPLFEVRPILTEQQRLQAERELLGAKEAAEGANEMASGKTVAGMTMWLLQGGKQMDRMERGAERAHSDAQNRLELLLDGKTTIDGMQIDFLVRSPIDGHVVSEDLEVGEPVVPASTFGPGTILLTLADLEHPVFRGTVDEIDVGRLQEGMRGELTLGARPGVKLEAELTEISLLAESANNATVFPVEMVVTPPEDLVLRSGYSAVANIRIEEAIDVLVLPERLVEFRTDGNFVLQDDGDGGVREVEVETGLSDGLQVEIRSGLTEGEVVLERIY